MKRGFVAALCAFVLAPAAHAANWVGDTIEISYSNIFQTKERVAVVAPGEVSMPIAGVSFAFTADTFSITFEPSAFYSDYIYDGFDIVNLTQSVYFDTVTQISNTDVQGVAPGMSYSYDGIYLNVARTQFSSDAALQGSTITYAVTFRTDLPDPSVPEPATWAMMVGGFGAVGASVRRRKRTAAAA